MRAIIAALTGSLVLALLLAGCGAGTKDPPAQPSSLTPSPGINSSPTPLLSPSATAAPPLTPTPRPSGIATPVSPVPTVLPSPTPAFAPTPTPFAALPLIIFSEQKDYSQTSPFTLESSPWRVDWDVDYWGFSDYDWTITLWSLKDGKGAYVRGLVNEIYDRRQNGSLLLPALSGTFYLVVYGPPESLGRWEIRIIDEPSLAPPPTPLPSPTPAPTPPSLASLGLPNCPLPETTNTYINGRYWYSIEVPESWELDSDDEEAVTISDPETGAKVYIDRFSFDEKLYPTLDDFVLDNDPTINDRAGWSDLVLQAESRIRSKLPVKAQEFEYKFLLNGVTQHGFEHWYVLGWLRARVGAYVDEDTWLGNEAVRRTLTEVLTSFEPNSYTSFQYGYSISHPPGWKVISSDDFDYLASCGTTTLAATVSQDITGITAISLGHYLQMPGAIASQLQFNYRGLTKAAWRVDYEADFDTTFPIRGAVIGVVVGENVVWIFIQDHRDNWLYIAALANRIFLRITTDPKTALFFSPTQ